MPFQSRMFAERLILNLAVATVLGNWHNVLQAISMASSEFKYVCEALKLNCL
jgi:hypothetical protein